MVQRDLLDSCSNEWRAILTCTSENKYSSENTVPHSFFFFFLCLLFSGIWISSIIQIQKVIHFRKKFTFQDSSDYITSTSYTVTFYMYSNFDQRYCQCVVKNKDLGQVF